MLHYKEVLDVIEYLFALGQEQLFGIKRVTYADDPTLKSDQHHFYHKNENVPCY